MQVSIYLREDLLRKIDRLAKRDRRSRSKIIEALIESSLEANPSPARFDALVGAWKDTRSAKEIIAEIYRDRRRNRRSNRVAL